MPGRRLRAVVDQRLAAGLPDGEGINRLAAKVEMIVDAFIDAEEIPIRLRRREEASASFSVADGIVDRVIQRIEAVIPIPFDDDNSESGK